MSATVSVLPTARGLVLDIFVPGRAAPQGSKSPRGRTATGRVILVESSKAVKPWRSDVGWHAAKAYSGPPLSGAVRVDLEFVMPRPAGTPKRRATPAAIKRPDLDKLTRAIFDALSAVIWRDDSQVIEMVVRKRIAEIDETPGCRIQVGET